MLRTTTSTTASMRKSTSLLLAHQQRAFSKSMQTLDRIGFIGLGQMGSRMAPHLVRKNQQNELFVFDMNQEAVNKIVKEGQHQVKQCASVKELAQIEKLDAIITMLPGPKQVSEVYLDHLLPNLKSQPVLIDASTIDPQTSQRVAQEATKRSLMAVDAPVSGGVGGAEAGTLTFMAGAPSEQVFERVKQAYLSLMGKNIVYCGANGMGQVAKICNNLVLAISMSGVSEAMLLGTQLGIDPKKLASIINTSSGRCWSSDTYNPFPGVMENVPSSRGYTGGFAANLMLKDVGLAVSAAESAGVPLPVGKRTQELYQDMSNNGKGGMDFSGVIEHLRSQLKK